MASMNILLQLLDIIYPPRCSVCGRFLSAEEKRRRPLRICTRCLETLTPVPHPLCTVCGMPLRDSSGSDHVCGNCLRNMPHYDFMRAPYVYEGALMSTIHRFKYSSETHLTSTLGSLLARFAKDLLPHPDALTTVPVPLHKHRLTERGFNQSLLLARIVSSVLGTPLDYRSLVREKDTRSQTGLARKDRKRNVAHAFSVISTSAFKRKNVLLVDDVLTTGYTLNECAQTLKQSGALNVICLALARTMSIEQP